MDDLEELRQLKARYFRFVDTKDWEGMRTVFSDDVRIDLSTSSGELVLEGVDAFMTYLAETLTDAETVHHGHTPELEITSADAARGIWAMEDRVRWPGWRELHGFGHYHETYRKVEGRWVIATLELTRLRVDRFRSRH